MRIYKSKLLLTLIVLLVIWVGVYAAVQFILVSYALSFRVWVKVIFWIVTVPISTTVVVAGIVMLIKYSSKRTSRLCLKITALAGALILAASLLYGGYIFLLLASYGYHPEHIVEKNEKKMVASVYTVMNVSVDYYEYINIFVRGNQWQISEHYGNGSYDPFERDVMPSPYKTYYNPNFGES